MTRTAPGKVKSCSDKVNEMLRSAALHKANGRASKIRVTVPAAGGCRIGGGNPDRPRRSGTRLDLGWRHRGSQKDSGINPRQFPPTLTFGRARSTQPHLLPARFDGYPARL